MAGMAKIFVAEVVEIGTFYSSCFLVPGAVSNSGSTLMSLAKDLQPGSEHPTGPLKPYHLKLARQVLEERGVLGASTSRETAVFRPKKALFRR